MGEQCPYKASVEGSNPSGSTSSGDIAQLVEHRADNAKVCGAIPHVSTKKLWSGSSEVEL